MGSTPPRRLIDRLTSPFASRSRNVAEFNVRLDEPFKQYSCGETVTGTVDVLVTKAMRITHLTVSLRGYVQVYRNPGAPGEIPKSATQNATGRGNRPGEYYGNGFATLFEDEKVLCGDGRLDAAAYQFQFELVFPDQDLPSSIEFERGAIAYNVTSTITRPTTISPTMTCEHKVYYVEPIDISPLPLPPRRIIKLEPAKRRERAKKQALKPVDTPRRGQPSNVSIEPGHESEASSDPSTQAAGGHDDSNSTHLSVTTPERSETSFDIVDSSRARTPSGDAILSPTGLTNRDSQTTVSQARLDSKVIIITVQSQAGGCLRGDNVPIKITVAHTKRVKSLYGVIVTLYRQARVDMHPALPLGVTEKGKGRQYEDYYPRSKTGLAGLSLSGAGSSHVFRKDMTQAILPLIVDPHDLTAEIHAKLRVPNDVFPTISTVPGGMISFQYYVEVVLDVKGKLAGQEHNFPGVVVGDQPGPPISSNGLDADRLHTAPFGSPVIDTAPIRREKSVVTVTFDLIVGTRDSERRKGKARAVDDSSDVQAADARQLLSTPDQAARAREHEDWYHNGVYADGGHSPSACHHCWPPDHHQQWHDEYHHHHHHDDGPSSAVPIPASAQLDESQMTEKQRIQRAEQRLLPSQPPDHATVDEGQAIAGATAPELPLDDDAHQSSPLVSVPGNVPPFTASCPPQEHEHDSRTRHAPDYDSTPPPPHPSSTYVSPSPLADDKSEARRRELQARASAPPLNDEHGHDHDVNNTAPPDTATAPPLDEDNHAPAVSVHDDESHTDATGTRTDLPVYEQ